MCARASPIPRRASLSGGNLQKFVVGRELDRKPGVLVVNQPTWGVDAGAAATIRQALIDLARQGSAVLVISQDLDEIFEIADRIAVISRGAAFGGLSGRTNSRAEKIGLLMAGAHEDEGGAPCGWCLRSAPSVRRAWRSLSPFIALLLTLIAGGIIFALRGLNPLRGALRLFRRAADRSCGRSSS